MPAPRNGGGEEGGQETELGLTSDDLINDLLSSSGIEVVHDDSGSPARKRK